MLQPAVSGSSKLTTAVDESSSAARNFHTPPGIHATVCAVCLLVGLLMPTACFHGSGRHRLAVRLPQAMLSACCRAQGALQVPQLRARDTTAREAEFHSRYHCCRPCTASQRAGRLVLYSATDLGKSSGFAWPSSGHSGLGAGFCRSTIAWQPSARPRSCRRDRYLQVSQWCSSLCGQQ